ncbi:cellulase family glycosylhydrolase [Niabella pedocola]|uniref:Cellulase family glycosylhydrolase n=1 Tax=Niabella pedocola TaxID=1752077 RepID=A0ABS8PUP1_9BACT|nr:cellulase family glycosylhydrolase [Niabella pedocola]MCD2424792.1 cellulase family glycosylhydrolase [Niabella pedocola]
MKIIAGGITLILGICWSCSFHAFGQPFLRTDGKKIVDGSGKEVLLRGMGLGGWMLQEGYMYQLGFLGQQYKIREKITTSVGAEKAAVFYDRWLENHTTKKDIAALASLGFNSIRLPMHYALYTLPVEQEPVAGGNTWLEKGFALTDSLLAWCKQYKMYLILDLHATPGGQGHDLPIADRNPAQPALWQSAANRKKTVALWKQLAQRYADEPWIGGYDIINEPNWGFDDENDKRGTSEQHNIPLKALLKEITAAIRSVDKHHIIIIEGNGFGNNYNGMFPLWDSNMVLSFHKYGNFNNTAAIQRFLDLREKYNVPLWLGESGENSNTWFREAIKLCEDNGIGWAWWQHKKMGINNPYEVKQPGGYKALLADWSGKGPTLAAAEAWGILNEWLENIKLEHNIFHADVADALFRQVANNTAIPFKPLTIADGLTIKATDYDMGAQRVAYYDSDSASYHYTPGVNTAGNRGWTYRNDGVDIKSSGNETYVYHIEDGEWLQYTITVKSGGYYRIRFRTRSEKEGVITVLNDDQPVTKITVPPASKGDWVVTASQPLKLNKGMHRLKLVVEKGGFEFVDMTLKKEK